MKIPNNIIEGDCLELMQNISDKSFDLVLTDPPYNAKNIGPKKRTYSLGQMQLPDRQYEKFCKDWFKQARRIGKTLVFTPGIANTHNYPQPDWIICWYKPAAVSFNKFGGYNVWEPIFVYGKRQGERAGQDVLKVNTLNFSKGPEKDHPCPKPPELWIKLVKIFSPEGGTVFDPFMGSGTTAVVAKLAGRSYAGLEINPEYVAITNQRLSQQVLNFNKLKTGKEKK